MKKLFLLAVIACFINLGVYAQTSTGNSAYGHSHKKGTKVKKAKKQNVNPNRNNVDRKVINVRHKSSGKTIRQNEMLTNQQQQEMVREANTNHKVEMKRETMSNRKAGKK